MPADPPAEAGRPSRRLPADRFDRAVWRSLSAGLTAFAVCWVLACVGFAVVALVGLANGGPLSLLVPVGFAAALAPFGVCMARTGYRLLNDLRHGPPAEPGH